MSRNRRQVELALRAIAVTSATSYVWLGRSSEQPSSAVRAELDERAARAYLVASIAAELYGSFYCCGRPVGREHRDWMPAYTDDAFVDALSRANGGRGGWDGGWCVVGIEPDGLLLERDGLQMRACPQDCRPAERAPRLGDLVGVRRDKEHRYLAPGFYTAIGDAADAAPPDALEVRFYFDVSAAGAAQLVDAVCGYLNAEGLPFVLKILDLPQAYVRCDAAVLYLREGDFERSRDVLLAVVSQCADHLGDGVPVFAKPLTCGVGVGEHRPTPASSFGSARCALVAAGIVDAHEQGARSLADRVDAVERAFAGAGLRLDLAHLAGLTDDPYAL